ncbi:MAG: hypothetical protein K6E13_09970 [Lachnospiraceae bacterium]|nr:hypothetical protein [Lachnospiraceae bacterium]
MINVKDILSLEYYKKTSFTGSDLAMRFKIEKYEEDDSKYLKVWHWKGPYAFDSTPDDQKTTSLFPFETESLDKITDYLNESSKSYNDDL